MSINEINVLVLAYLGDTIYEDYIRKYLINKNIAKVNNGTIYAISVGNAVITAKSGNVSAQCAVKVMPILLEAAAMDPKTFAGLGAGLAIGLGACGSAEARHCNRDDIGSRSLQKVHCSHHNEKGEAGVKTTGNSNNYFL